MKKKKILLTKTSLVEYDARLEREIDWIKDKDYEIILLCWDRERLNNSQPKNPLYKEIRFMLKAPFGIKILPYIPIWWSFELYSILKLKVDLIHSIDFDSIVPALIAAKIKRIPIIYEIYDIYEDEIKLPRPIRIACVFIDKIFMFLSDAIIIVDETRIQELNGIPNDKIVTIYNSPDDSCSIAKSDTHQTKEIVIFFAGLLNRNRCLVEFINAVKEIPNVKLVIAGFGEFAERIRLNSEENKIDFIGKINYKRVLELSCSADILFSFYNPVIPLNKYASSNKLFEAMMCGKPIIVNDGTSMAEIVNREDCGIVIPYGDVKAIKKAILLLRDNSELRRKLGANGRKAYEEKYNSILLRKKLAEIYESLLN